MTLDGQVAKKTIRKMSFYNNWFHSYNNILRPSYRCFAKSSEIKKKKDIQIIEIHWLYRFEILEFSEITNKRFLLYSHDSF